jgi:hypothetical protein
MEKIGYSKKIEKIMPGNIADEFYPMLDLFKESNIGSGAKWILRQILCSRNTYMITRNWRSRGVCRRINCRQRNIFHTCSWWQSKLISRRN